MSTSDTIQLWQTIGTWIMGLAGAVFIWRQNGILSQQNDIMENQRELNTILIQRELEEGRQDDLRRSLDLIEGGVFPKDEDLDAEIERLESLGFSMRHIRATYAAMTKGLPYSGHMYERLTASENRKRNRRALDSM